MERSMSRMYGRVMWEDRWLAGVYWFVFTLVLWVVGVSGIAAALFRLEIMVSMIVGLLGLFIALWVINRERNKKITEGYFYKTGILEHVERMMGAVSTFYLEVKYMDPSLMALEKESERGTLLEFSEPKVNELKDREMSHWEYYQRLAEMININTVVPAEVRVDVSVFLRRGSMAITKYLWNNLNGNKLTIQYQLLKKLDKVIGSDYFTGDSTDEVENYLRSINGSRCFIRKHVGL